jgi:hypothetical protein
MNVTAQVVKQTPVITLWMIISLTLVLQVYIWNDSEKQRQHSLMATPSGSRMFKTWHRICVQKSHHWTSFNESCFHNLKGIRLWPTNHTAYPTELMKPRTTDLSSNKLTSRERCPVSITWLELRTDLSTKYRSKPQPLPGTIMWSPSPVSIILSVPSTWSTSTLSAHRFSVGSKHNQKTLNSVV